MVQNMYYTYYFLREFRSKSHNNRRIRRSLPYCKLTPLLHYRRMNSIKDTTTSDEWKVMQYVSKSLKKKCSVNTLTSRIMVGVVVVPIGAVIAGNNQHLFMSTPKVSRNAVYSSNIFKWNIEIFNCLEYTINREQLFNIYNS